MPPFGPHAAIRPRAAVPGRGRRLGPRRRAGAPPRGEPLEGRLLLTVTDHGGPILTNVQAETLFLGSGWATDPGLQQQAGQVNAYVTDLVQGSFMSMLAGYGAGPGNFAGTTTLAANEPAGSTISDSQIQQQIAAEVQAGKLSLSPNTLIIVYVAPGVGVSSGGASSRAAFSGYHDDFADPTTHAQVPYVVVPYPGSGTPAIPTLTTFEQLTEVTSHETSEAITDPEPEAKVGWYDDNPHLSQGGEIADIAWGHDGFVDGYVIQAVVNQGDQVILPNGAVPFQVSLTPINPPPGQSFQGTIATFFDPDLSLPSSPRAAGDYTATIDWGNGQTTTGTVTRDSPGHFEVAGAATFTQGGTYNVSVTITDSRDGDSLTTSETVTVANLPLQGSLATVAPMELSPFSGTVATFRDMDPTLTAGNFTATIQWGDGQTSPATIAADPSSGFDAIATHAFNTSGSYPMTVMVQDTDGNTTTITGTAHVGDLPLSASAASGSFTAQAGTTFSATLATFTDTDARGVLGNYSAQVNWGDGQTSAAAVGAGPQGGFTVQGFHTYADGGSYTIVVTINDGGGAQATTVSTISVTGGANDGSSNGGGSSPAAGSSATPMFGPSPAPDPALSPAPAPVSIPFAFPFRRGQLGGFGAAFARRGSGLPGAFFRFGAMPRFGLGHGFSLAGLGVRRLPLR